jgi:hypothetical protein
VNDGGWLPRPSREIPAIAVIGEPFSEKRCFADDQSRHKNEKSYEAEFYGNSQI